MNLAVLVLLVVLSAYFFETNQITLLYATLILLLADLVGGIISKILAGIWGILTGIVGTAKGEVEEMDKAKPKPPKGMEFISKGLERTGKELGKAEAAKRAG
ncbi:MAG: hypothetical protein NUV67_00390, partial [archaeon]|nr:hypothetical protein [archaeon]